MTIEVETHPDDVLDRRLRSACHAVIPRLLDEPAQPSFDVGLDDSSQQRPVRDEPTATSRPRRVRAGSIAAGLVLVAGAAAAWSVVSRDPAAPPLADAPGSSRLPDAVVSTILGIPLASLPATGVGMSGFDPLPVVPGVSDFYVGAAVLGTPTVNLDLFDSISRCSRLTADFSACQKIEGLAAVELVTYPTPYDAGTIQTVPGDAASPDEFVPAGIGIGTTFTDVSPETYAETWGPTAGGGATVPVTVRGHHGVRYDNEASPAVVWQERPGVLVWITVPVELEADLIPMAEGIRQVPGPSTIPNRVMVAGLSQPWTASDNNGVGVVVGRSAGIACVGLDFVDPCTASDVPLVGRGVSDGATRFAGSTPADVLSVELHFADGTSMALDTVAFTDSAVRLFALTIDAAAAELESVSWIDSDGTTTSVEAVSSEPDADKTTETIAFTTADSISTD